jgi:hypothetical protein
MITITSSDREISRWAKRPKVGLLDYLLIRLITVFDPAFVPGLFLPVILAFGFRLMNSLVTASSMARRISKEYVLIREARQYWAKQSKNST